MMVTVVVNILNIAGNYILIFGKLGMPALGVEGAAISTSIARGVSMLILLLVCESASCWTRTSVASFSSSAGGR